MLSESTDTLGFLCLSGDFTENGERDGLSSYFVSDGAIEISYTANNLSSKTEDSSSLFVNTDKYETKEVAEVYEFYASYEETGATAEDTPRTTLGSKVNAGKDTGYSEENAVDKDDPHYGWDIGSFFINGYTRTATDSDNETVFLKNVGDKVTLWFTLEQDISCLNGNEKLAVSDDTNGYDQYFEIEKTDFGKGTLIIRYTDNEGVKHKPVIYTDFLEAVTRTGADTRVQLFEEGDYEVALDYEITDKSGLLNSITNTVSASVSQYVMGTVWCILLTYPQGQNLQTMQLRQMGSRCTWLIPNI